MIGCQGCVYPSELEVDDEPQSDARIPPSSAIAIVYERGGDGGR